METVNATITKEDGLYYLSIVIEDQTVRIPLSEDNAIEVKQAFGQLIHAVRQDAFQIEFQKEDEDLFSHVAEEYIKQLNKELLAVRTEMQELQLLDEEE